jgi:predicted aldo/keto reductase-like oxidoreductase
MEIVTLSNSPASILGLAGNSSMEIDCVESAFTAGINYFFFYNLSSTNFLDGLKALLKNKREEILVATGSESRDENELDRYLNQVRQRLNIDVVDVFFLEYISPTDDFERIKTILDRLNKNKEKGLLRYVGITVHNRPVAMKSLEHGHFDLLMHRYNMAHRKAERDVLPAAQNAGIPVIAFTCTRWGSLLKGHPNWQEKIAQAADCYRYAIQQKAIRLALTSPQTLIQLNENLKVLKDSGMSEAEKAFWQSYGDLIYGDGRDSFDTQWA